MALGVHGLQSALPHVDPAEPRRAAGPITAPSTLADHCSNNLPLPSSRSQAAQTAGLGVGGNIKRFEIPHTKSTGRGAWEPVNGTRRQGGRGDKGLVGE